MAFMSIESVFWLVAILAVIGLTSARYSHGLHKFNGPFLASFTNLWRICHAYRNSYRGPMIHLHAKYGDAVRVGPNVVSFGNPRAIKDIYGPGKNWRKSDYYPVNAAVSKGEMAHTLFSSPDPEWHKNLRRSINSAFTSSTVAGYEPLVDSTIGAFLKQIDTRFANKAGEDGVVDLPSWLLFFTFDTMGQITYGSRHGFIEAGRDVKGIIGYVQSFLTYGFLFGQAPILDLFLRHNVILLWLERRGWYHSSTFPLVPFALEQIAKRRKSKAVSKSSTERTRTEDLLDKFLEASDEHPNAVGSKEILGLSLSTIIAGAETTGITLAAIFYYLLKNPKCYSKLQDEFDQRLISRPPIFQIPFCVARELQYLHACIQETFRLHPAFGFNFERVVPPTGAIIDDHFLPGGTVVGCNAWVIHRNESIFGNDVNEFRPERWLEDEKKTNMMNRTLFQFGTGIHVCLGKHVSLLEIYKMVPSLMMAFKISLNDSTKEWNLYNGANVRVRDVKVRFERKCI